MSEDRRRSREGRHVSVGGTAADEVLDALVQQFSDRYAFIRELIQNSLDAGAARIDIRMEYDGRALRIAVTDDGDGMDRAIIEGYLLTLFRSTKEDDLTKIGKFGIGFTSIFAMEPAEVVVDTGRDGVWHRVTFDASRAYTLSRLADPYEGTTVTLRLPRGRTSALEDVRGVRAAAARWCRYADAAITLEAVGTDEEWEPTPVAAPFTVDAPVVVVDETDGMHVVLGPHASRTPPVGFYNRGITLWEGELGTIPGVCFRVAGRHLEHTLTRDNVIRDRHYDAVVARLQELARTRLAAAVHAEAEAAAVAGDLARTRRLFAAISEAAPWSWREDAPLVPGRTASGAAPLSLAALRATRGWLARLGGGALTVWWARPDCPVGAALAASGTLVVLAENEDDPHLLLLGRALTATRRAATTAWATIREVSASAEVAPLFSGASTPGSQLRPARFAGAPLADRLAVSAPAAGLLPDPLPAPSPAAPLFVAVNHPLVARLAAMPPAIGQPLLLHAARISAGNADPHTTRTDTLVAALTSEEGN